MRDEDVASLVHEADTIHRVREAYLSKELLLLIPDSNASELARGDNDPEGSVVVKACQRSFVLFLLFGLDHA